LKIFPFYFKHLFPIEKWQQQMLMNFKMFLQVKIPQMMVSFSKYDTKTMLLSLSLFLKPPFSVFIQKGSNTSGPNSIKLSKKRG
jgi:hypothetical protein